MSRSVSDLKCDSIIVNSDLRLPVVDTTNNSHNIGKLIYNGSTDGLEFANGTAWVPVVSSADILAGANISVSTVGSQVTIAVTNPNTSQTLSPFSGKNAFTNLQVTSNKIGSVVTLTTLDIPATAVGSTDFQVVGLAAAFRPTTDKSFIIQVNDNGTLGAGYMTISTAGAITIYPTLAAGSWTGTSAISSTAVTYNAGV
jgi:hypothetical protein